MPHTASGRPGNNVREFEHRRQLVEGRDAGREAERGDVHVAVDEPAAGDERSRRDARAAGGAEIDDERQARGLRAADAASRRVSAMAALTLPTPV